MSLCLTQLRLLFFVFLFAKAAGLAVMSVDFGNEFMKTAIVKPGVPMEIVLNKESHRKTPTIVTLKDGERLFGDAALNAGIRFPKNTYRYLLDVLGKHFDNPLVEQYQKKFPFYNLVKDEETGMVLFQHEDGVLYSPEELIAMILQKAKEYSETFAEQPIGEAVITVPPFFNQAERRAMLRAAELAGLKVLQLINDNTAVALNYGVFRRKVFNETATNYMFFDIGASYTSATIVAYQIIKAKSPESSVIDEFPQLTVKGVGIDRTLGGMEFQLRLRDLLARHFNAAKKTKNDVTKDARAMQKLFKEAGRVKQVLSANVDHFAQVENLLDDEDFRFKVTREELEDLCQDLFSRIGKVVQDALASSEMSMDDIFEVILMGGGTRMPRIQETLKAVIKREDLGKGINTDEAAALGAVYQAAHLGKGFKVKKFAIRDAVLYPVEVEFERVKSKDDSSDVSETIKRVLFGRMQSYPQKKAMTFNKHIADFSFELNYGDLSFLSEVDLKAFGNTTLGIVTLTGVEDAYTKNSGDSESKGVKAHFRMDDSGLIHLDKVESIFEKMVTKEAESEESTLSKIGNTISNLFGGGKKVEEMEGGVEDEQKDDIPSETKAENSSSARGDSKSDGEQKQKVEKTESEPENTDDAKEEEEIEEEPSEKKPGTTEEESQTDAGKTSEESTDNKTGEGAGTKDEKSESNSADDLDKMKEQKKEDKKPKLITVRADIKAEKLATDLTDPSKEKLMLSKKLIDDLKKQDEEKTLLEKAKNEFEAFVFDAQDKLEQKNYKLCSTEEERTAISEKLAAASDWLNEQDDSTPRKEYDSQLKELKSVTKDLYGRVYEMLERPAAIEALNSMLNHTAYFLFGMKNFTGEDQPFTQAEYDALEKLVIDTVEWNKTVNEEQKKTSLTENPKFTVQDVAMKIAALDRDVKYLISKVKSYRPKPKVKVVFNNQTESANNETKATDDKTTPEKGDPLDQDVSEDDGDDNDQTAETSDSTPTESSTKKNQKASHNLEDEL